MQRSFKPYMLLAIAAILVVILSFTHGNSLADFHLHDSYFVFKLSQAFLLIAFSLALLFFIYYFIQHLALSKNLVQTHLIFTLVGSALLMWFFFQSSKGYIPGYDDLLAFKRNNSLIQISLLFLLITQLLFIGTIIVKLIRKAR